jgi:opacity protein-like surface antigen
MKSFASTALGLAAGALVITSPAGAQRLAPSGPNTLPSQWALDGSIGFAVPVGSYGNGLNTGFDLMGAIEYHPQTTPHRLYFRGEVGWSHFGASNVDGHSNVVRFVGDILYDFPVYDTPLQPYALTGLGIYHVTVQACDAAGVCAGDASTGIGFNIGGGVRYAISPQLQAFFEARYHIVFSAPGSISDAPFFPFQFGLRTFLPQ